MDHSRSDDDLERRLDEYFAHAQRPPSTTAMWARLAPMLAGEPGDVATNGWHAPAPETPVDIPIARPAAARRRHTRHIWPYGAVIVALLLVALAVGLFAELGNQRGSHNTQIITTPPPACDAHSIHADLPKDLTLNTITMTSPDEGWAAGLVRDAQGESGIILHYTHCRWSVSASGISGWSIGAIAMASRDEGWAEGGRSSSNGELQQLLLHYIRGRWEQMTLPADLPAQTAQGQLAMSRGEGWVSLFEGTDYYKREIWKLFHYTGGTWTQISLPSGLDALSSDFSAFPGTGIVSLGPDDAWPLAYNPTSGVSIPSHYDAGKWTTWPLPEGWNIGQVIVTSPTDGWAMGSSVTPVHPTNTPSNWAAVMLRFDGHTWTPVPLPDDKALQTLSDGRLSGPGDGWIFTIKQISRMPYPQLGTVTAVYHYLNGAWKQVNWPFVDDTPLLVGTIERVASGDYWAIGLQDGVSVLLHYANGQWTKYGQP